MKEVKGFKTETRETRKKENEKPRQPREHPEGCGSRKPSRNNNKERRLEAKLHVERLHYISPRTLTESGPDQGIILQNDGTLRKTKNLLSKQKTKQNKPSV